MLLDTTIKLFETTLMLLDTTITLFKTTLMLIDTTVALMLLDSTITLQSNTNASHHFTLLFTTIHAMH